MVKAKKYLALIVAFFYLTLSSGLVLNAHYCGEQLAAIGVMDATKSCCCDNEVDNECCSDKTVVLQLDIDQHLTKTTSSKKKDDSISLISYLVSNYKVSNPESELRPIVCTDFAVNLQLPLWLLFSSFIFYA